MNEQNQLLQNVKQTVLSQFPENRILAAAETTIAEFTETLDNIRNGSPMQHLSAARIGMINTAIGMTTFSMQLQDQPREAKFVNDANGIIVHQSITLVNREDYARANILQLASVVVESINLVLKIIGIQYPADRIMVVIEDVSEILMVHGRHVLMHGQLSKMRKIDNNISMVENMIRLFIIAYQEKILLNVLKKYFNYPVGMHLEDWLEVSAKISGFSEVMITQNDGCADIARLVNKMVIGAGDSFFENLRNANNYYILSREAIRTN